ncbi:hypothetical protein PS624_01575 [Pseudomonas fluorescens]|uniref:Uncharacterized protein n=1 Tax=Pseudomonas fluorescens TaxID=294 RepID=A0A5E6RFG9_PSEFL|nr:hypothetical protein PS624_01575 [Pseudomonas fluorescens]
MFPRYGVHPGASPTVCFAAPPLDECDCAARRCAPTPRMNTFARPAEGAKDQKPKPKPKQDQKPDQEPLTLALSHRERGLTEVFGRATPTCDTELNSSFEKPKNRPPLPRERAGVRGSNNANQKPNTHALHHSIGRVSARLLLILIHGRRRKAEWRDSSGGGSAATVRRSRTHREEVQRSKP